MDYGIYAGDTSKTIYVRLRDSTTGLAKTGLTFESTGAVASYVLPGAARASITLVTQTVTGAYSSGGFVEVDATNCKGLYRLDLPNAAIASGDYTLISIEFDGVIEETQQIPLHVRSVNMTKINGAFTDGSPAVGSRPILSLQQLNAHCNIDGEGAMQLLNDHAGGAGMAVAGENIDIYLNGSGVMLNASGKPVAVNTASILGTALTETTPGWLAASFKKLFDVQTPAMVASDVMRGTNIGNLNNFDGTGATLADGAITAAKIGADAITNAKIADDAIAAENLKTGAFTADAFAANALVAATFATDSIAAAAIKADAVTKIQDGLIDETVWYVATTGNDGNGGHSWDDALLTIPQAVNTSSGVGDTIKIGEGTFDCAGTQVLPQDGQTIIGMGSGATVIQGAQIVSGVVLVTAVTGVRLAQLKIEGTSAATMGLKVTSSSECLVDDCIIDGDFDGARLDGIDRSLFRRCQFLSTYDAVVCNGSANRFVDCEMISGGVGSDGSEAGAFRTDNNSDPTSTETAVTLERCYLQIDRTAIEASYASGVEVDAYSRVSLIDCNIRAESTNANDTGDMHGVTAQEHARVMVSGGSVETINAGAGTEKDLVNTVGDSATLRVVGDGCDYDSAKTTGTITTEAATQIAALHNFDSANDAVANVTTTGTVTNAVSTDADSRTASKATGFSTHNAAAVKTAVEAEGSTLATITAEIGDAGAGLTACKLASGGLDSISTIAPAGVASNFREMVVQTWRRFFSPATMTRTQATTYSDDGATVTTQTVSDDGTTQTQGKAS